jgi:hypothetical protein
VGVALSACGGGRVEDPALVLDPVLSALAEDVVSHALDPAAPGRGIPDYPYDGAADIPKAYAMVLRAGLRHPRPGPLLRSMALTSEGWLREYADANADGVVGWGLPFAWDAFGDGSPNPAGSSYAISTAIVIDALLDRASATGPELRAETVDLAWRAIAPYLEASSGAPAGVAPYSLTPQDRSYLVFNSAAYLGAMAQRLSREALPAGQVAALQSLADRTMRALLDARRTTAQGAWFWPYMQPGNAVNDLPHASYIVYAIQSYVRHGGRLAGDFPLAEIRSHLSDFVDGATGRVFAYPTFTGISAPARSYDIGFGLVAVCSGMPALADVRRALTDAAPGYRAPDGHYAKWPTGGGSDVPPVVNEYETYLLFGAVACLHADNAGW